MTEQKTYIIGDIHGCLDMLKRLMLKMNWNPEQDRLIFLGDYIDRGEDSKGVVDYILDLFKLSKRIDCLLGNHEKLFLDFLDGKDSHNFIINGGNVTLESYRIAKSEHTKNFIPQEHIRFFQSLQLWIELDDYYVVHAGFQPGIEIGLQIIEDMVWIRESFIYSNYDFGKKVIFGHTPFLEPLVMENKIGIDTGAVYGNTLTCLELPSCTFHSVEGS
ncbi:MAG: serine/threonine protein phosphatase [Desulfobacteraceae bacterium]|nr:MAG: serine/threonine protein phosphatase [Desulfobacteraceae bacterium]